VALYDGETPLAGAALAEVGDGLAIATEIAIAHERTDLGAPLLDALETAARERGATRIRLDSSAFLLGDALPWERYGYAVGPPYAGDTDVEVWAEKPITGGVAVP
jgi:hypothetical protein